MDYNNIALFIKSVNIVMNPDYIGMKFSSLYTCISVGDIEVDNSLLKVLVQTGKENKNEFYDIMTIQMFLRMVQSSKDYISMFDQAYSVLDQQEIQNKAVSKLISELYAMYRA
jgi:hypothetical protein